MSLSERTLAKATSSPRLVLPFVDTQPLTDVKLAILLLPVWWWLGVEQFIWPVIFGIATVKTLYLQNFRLIATRPLRWFALFIIAVLISGFFVEESMRYVTYARNLGAFASGFLVYVVITNRARSVQSIDKLLDAILLVMILAGVAGLLGVLDIWRPAVHSLMGRVLPESIVATSYGRVIAFRELGQYGWFVGLGLYFRLSSFFLFGNYFSSAIVYTLPFLFMRMGQSRGARKVFVGLAIVLLIINLIYTTGRVAALSLLAGALYFALFHSLYRRAIRTLAAVGLSLGILAILFVSVMEVSSTTTEAGLIEQTGAAVEAFVFARGSGSYDSRFGLYQATLVGFLERPFFGWGTERDVEGLSLPAGSHSEYLAALYRQGLLGVLALAGMVISVWFATRPPRGSAARSKEGSILRYGRWFLVGAVLNSTMNDPAVDATAYVLMWAIMGLLVATSLMIKKQGNDAPAFH